MSIPFLFRSADSIYPDYSELENLEVYGDFLSLYSLPIDGTIAEVGNIFDTLEELDTRIFCLYVSYVLSKAGFYWTDILNPDEMDDSGKYAPEDYTTKFDEKDWLEMGTSGPLGSEKGGIGIWSMQFENEEKAHIHIFFVTTLWDNYKPPVEFVLGSSYYVIHPRLFRKAKEDCKDFAERLRKEMGCDLVLSTGQFAAKYLPDKEKREIVEANWVCLRERILGEFQKKWKLLTYALYKEDIEDSRNELRKARLKLDSGNDLEEAVFHAGVACEGLLKALHSSERDEKIHERMGFDDYLNVLSDLLRDEFGEDIFSDLKLVKEWRNKVAHAPRKIPDSRTALKIVNKAELFQKLFDDYLKKQTSSKK